MVGGASLYSGYHTGFYFRIVESNNSAATRSKFKSLQGVTFIERANAHDSLDDANRAPT